MHRQLFDSEASEEDFRRFYLFLFPFLKSDGAKTIPAEMAIPLLGISLGERYELGKAFVDFATVRRGARRSDLTCSWLLTLRRTAVSRSCRLKAPPSRPSRSTSGRSCSSSARASSRT